MRKILAITLLLASAGLTASAAEMSRSGASISAAGVASNATAPQWRERDRWGRRNNRRARVYTQTRLVRYGGRIYRETYQVWVLPNGRTQTRLVSRVRVR